MSSSLFSLIRLALGVPDYYHPRVHVESDFLERTVGRYPMTMRTKADPPTRSKAGIPVSQEGITPPVMAALYGLGSHHAYCDGGGDRYQIQMDDAVRWLDENKIPFGDGIAWTQNYDLPAFGLKAPWHSALVQGLALSLFVRAHQIGWRGNAARLARLTWLGFQVKLSSGGFRRETAEGAVFEEYPCQDLDCVFNGMCQALIGLWEAHWTGLVPEAEADFQAGVQALHSYLPRFDCEGWSLYSLNRCLEKPFLASPYYQRANAVLAIIIGRMSGIGDFGAYGERWLKADTLLRRIRMSRHVAIDRIRFSRQLASRLRQTREPHRQAAI